MAKAKQSRKGERGHRPAPKATTSAKRGVTARKVRTVPLVQAAASELSLASPEPPPKALPLSHVRDWLRQADWRLVGVGISSLLIGVIIGLGWPREEAAPSVASVPPALDTVQPSKPATEPAVTAAAVPAEQITVAAGPASSPAVTGSVGVPGAGVASTGSPAAPPTIIGDWRLLEIHGRFALVEGRGAVYRVYVGMRLQGAGRITEIREVDGKPMVMTSEGVILPGR